MSATIPVRVTVLDSWDTIELDLAPDMLIGEVKAAALRAARTARPPDEYLTKFLGAELTDESATVGSTGIPANGALIVLSRRRVPAR